MDDGYSLHIIEYPFEGGKWSVHVPARSFEEAEARIAAAYQYGKCVGGQAQCIPAAPGAGLLVRVLTWWRNLLRA